MANPASHTEARTLAQTLLSRSQPGARHTTVTARVKLAGQIAECVWKRWQVGPWQWRLKHITWYLDVAIKTSAPATRYRHWRAIRAVLYAMQREHLAVRLEHRRGPAGNFLRPDGLTGPLKATGRPAKLPGRARRVLSRDYPA